MKCSENPEVAFMKTLICSLITLLVTLPTIAGKGDMSPYGFKYLQGSRLNNNLETALKKIGCRVRSFSGVTGVSAAHHKANPTSCHEVGMAIDIASLSCDNSRSNEENLWALFDALVGYTGSFGTVLVCYKEGGRCKPGAHDHHLHYGAAEWLFCKF
jgi:hypothetical protein